MGYERKPMQVRVGCSCCMGTGMVPVTGKYLETLKLLTKNPGITGAELSVIAGIFPTAMNNRLTWLADKGLATYEQYGKMKKYTATELPGMDFDI